MKIIDFNLKNFSLIKDYFDKNITVILPSDTSYGFSGFLNLEAVSAVENIKNRENKPFLILVKDLETLKKYADFDLNQAFLDYFNQSEATTFLLPKSSLIPKDYFPNFPEIGIRVPKNNPLLMDFLKFIDKPIFSTSANFAGQPSIYKSQEILDNFGLTKDLLFADYKDLPIVPNSRIIKIQNDQIIRLR